jgi:Fuc2NAc and GlcNAc transferase
MTVSTHVLLVLIWLLVCVGGTARAVGAFRDYALSRGMIDVPNHRSSHREATARGGGIVIVAVCLAGVALALALGWLAPRAALALGGGGIAVAAVGWLDDRNGVPARVRLLVHFAAAAWAVFCIRPALLLPGLAQPLAGVAADVLAVFGIVWLVNLYNFMDGIDGIAGGEAVTTGVAGGAMLWLVAPGIALLYLTTGAAALGFLRWNWAPARIFMGDVCSGFLGFLFAALALAAERVAGVPSVLLLLPLLVFILDATWTLFARLLRGERVHEAHRTHTYQRLVAAGWSHARVSTLVIACNIVLGALAIAAALWQLRTGVALALGTTLVLVVGAAALARTRDMTPMQNA